MPADRASPASASRFQLPPRSLSIAGIAFGIGVLLFVLVWLGGRKNDVAGPDPDVAEAQATLQPLPAPLPAGAGASEMPDARPVEEDERPQLVETVPPPVQQEPTPAEIAAASAAATPASTGPVERPRPLADSSPAPQYPPAALRRGERGTVVVRVDVDANGMPGGVTLVQRSGSRALDRAAMEAVRRWRFQPATRDGQPVEGSLEIPFDFTP